MRPKPHVPSAVVFLLIAGAAGASGATLEILHQPVPCALAGVHPRVEARVPATGDPIGVQVVFRAEGTPHWYAVEMRPEGDLWAAALPRPQGAGVGTRFVYFLLASRGGARARLPESSAFIVDVAVVCPEGSLAVAAEGPAELGVPSGAPRVPPGFDAKGIGDYVQYVPPEATAPDRPGAAAAGAPLVALPIQPLAQVRVTTVAPPAERQGVLWEDAASVTLSGQEDEKPITFSKPGRRLEGRLETVEDDTLVLALKKGGTVRVRAQDIVGLAERQPASSGLAVVGGLAGAASGFLLTGLVCLSGAECGSVNTLWAGTLAGMVIGGVAASTPEWKQVTLSRRGRFALALEPRPAGAALGVTVGF
jgi:hypothetical protein